MPPLFSAINRRLLVGAIVILNVVLWCIPSNVLELVAREQHVLCGRYSRTQFGWILAIAVLSIPAIYLGLSRTPAMLKRRAFALAAVLIVIIPVGLVADVLLRARTEYPYQMDRVVYHRPPNKVYHQTYEDAPEARRSYPSRRPGFGRVECTLTYDELGYRNAGVPTTCDVVTVGDSFTEGSRVSDDQAWPAVLAKRTGLKVYNLGISGYNPPEYLAALKEYGLARKPKYVVCMLYEGNDFRTGEVAAKSGVSLKQVVRTSPLLLGANSAIVRLFGAIGADRNDPSLDVLSWMPIEFPRGSNARHYAFAPKQITELNVTAEEFGAGEEWFAVKGVLRQMADACEAAGARFVVAYAPNKAHVIFPQAAPDLPAEKVRQFAAIRVKKQPPPAAEFMREASANLENRERVIREYCDSKAIPFVSMTQALRLAARDGRQGYYTYDQHWTPIGHEVAAQTVEGVLRPPGKSMTAASDRRD